MAGTFRARNGRKAATGAYGRANECATTGQTSVSYRVRSSRPPRSLGIASHAMNFLSFRRNTNTETENTVHKLFLAQRQPNASPVPSAQPDAQPSLTVAKPQKSTLHSFWTIAAPPVQVPIFSYHTTQSRVGTQGPRCEDCDAQLDIEEGVMDVDMDMGGMDEEGAFACVDCGRSVCGTCAVVRDVRRCLQCATHGY